MSKRKPILAGSWYPATAEECRREIDAFVHAYDAMEKIPSGDYVGGIVPHAGWYFSGSIACNVIKNLAAASRADAVVVFGMHLHTNSSNYIMKEGAWETPLGDMEIEKDLAEKLADRFPFLIETPERFVQDNTIEVQLPFIKHFFKNARLVPVGVPPTVASLDIGRAVVDMANQLGLKIAVLGSTDLTHYGSSYGFSPKGFGNRARTWVEEENDAVMIQAILSMDPHEILKQAREHQNACCSGAVATAIATVKSLGATKSRKVAYATSYEKSPGDSFVGYTGILFA